MISKLGLASLIFAALPAAALFADSTAGFYGGGGNLNNFPNATGYFFTPNVNLTVTALGIYDAGAPGFTDSHDVGIFLANGTPVTNTTLAAGLPGFAADGSRFLSVAPVGLTGGTQYYIEGNNWTTDQFAFGTGAVTYAPEITWNGFGDSNSNSIFGSVTNLGGQPGNLGPNFQFTTAPEPGSLVLLGLGCVTSLLRKRK
jgi:hypothetical protein